MCLNFICGKSYLNLLLSRLLWYRKNTLFIYLFPFFFVSVISRSSLWICIRILIWIWRKSWIFKFCFVWIFFSFFNKKLFHGLENCNTEHIETHTMMITYRRCIANKYVRAREISKARWPDFESQRCDCRRVFSLAHARTCTPVQTRARKLCASPPL